ncbi:F-box family protein [Raphanus sativus]|uniref:F-box protein At1g30790-like n=1 Tax=Raphanus sativus TaxID=3726 RepID=A0A6J0MCK9_RAPSA|nr:F-box protein At1g30790-like [Raphanus sativus]KAJ4910939.1 F-box family protein [Raphanus sativus]
MEDSKQSLSRRLRREQDRAADNYTTTIPFDLIIEILSFLPAKSLIRFQSVSKLWFSTIRTKNFIDLFLTRSKTRPRLLLTFLHLQPTKRFILSAPEHNNNEDVDKSSSTVTLRHDMAISDPVYCNMSRPVNGLVCCRRNSSITVCNPATRKIVKLPDVTRNGRDIYARLGYDPVQDQYKVLCVMTKFNLFRPDEKDIRQEHLVCTVTSSEKQEWRKIENTTIDCYRSFSEGICIDGAIYYEAGQSRIVRFDVRTENIKVIKVPEESDLSRTFPSTLLNYKGKLGGVDYPYNKSVMMRLWILEDAEKQEWSSMTCVLPSELKYLLGSYVVSKGDIHNGELMVFHPWSWSSTQIFFWYYDFKKESLIRKLKVVVDGDFRRIHGMGELNGDMLCYPGYFENVRFL